MSMCILTGHTAGEPVRGHGEHRNSMFTLCLACGKTLAQEPVDEPADPYLMPNAFQRIERGPATAIGE